MTDRELLELAAKAAELNYDPTKGDEIGRVYSEHLGLWIWHWDDWFNPLEDDGDALRLAVKLGICYGPNFDGDMAVCFGNNGRNITESYGQDKYDATRRAIVRAAAEIGKSMPVKE